MRGCDASDKSSWARYPLGMGKECLKDLCSLTYARMERQPLTALVHPRGRVQGFLLGAWLLVATAKLVELKIIVIKSASSPQLFAPMAPALVQSLGSSFNSGRAFESDQCTGPSVSLDLGPTGTQGLKAVVWGFALGSAWSYPLSRNLWDGRKVAGRFWLDGNFKLGTLLWCPSPINAGTMFTEDTVLQECMWSVFPHSPPALSDQPPIMNCGCVHSHH